MMTRLVGLAVAFAVAPLAAQAQSAFWWDLYDFPGSPTGGSNPHGAAPMQSVDTNVYGVTEAGGVFGLGTIYQATFPNAIHGGPFPTVSVLYSFGTAPNDGANPAGALIQDAGGNFYGVTANGGTNGLGTIYEYSPSAGLTVLHDFAGGADGCVPLVGLTLVSGALYGNTWGCGTFWEGVLFKLFQSGNTWTYQTLHEFGGAGDIGSGTFNTPLLLGPDNNLYGTTNESNTGCGSVYQYQPALNQLTYIKSFACSKSDGAFPVGALAQDSTSSAASVHLYGVTNGGGGWSSGTVFKLTQTSRTQWSSSILYAFHGTGIDGSAPDSGLLYTHDNGGSFAGTSLYGKGPLSLLFDVTPAGAFTVLSNNIGGSGSNPLSPLILVTQCWPASPVPPYPGPGCGTMLFGASFSGGPQGNGFLYTIAAP